MTEVQSSRRDFLVQSAASLGVASLSQSLNVQSVSAADCTDTNQHPWIDAHSHIWTRDVEHYPLANEKTVDDLDPASFTTEELLKVAHQNNVGRVVLIAHNVYYRWDNSYMTDAAKKYPGRFRVVGMIDDSKPHPDVAMRKLLKKRVTGFRITSWIRGKDCFVATRMKRQV